MTTRAEFEAVLDRMRGLLEADAQARIERLTAGKPSVGTREQVAATLNEDLAEINFVQGMAARLAPRLFIEPETCTHRHIKLTGMGSAGAEYECRACGRRVSMPGLDSLLLDEGEREVAPDDDRA